VTDLPFLQQSELLVRDNNESLYSRDPSQMINSEDVNRILSSRNSNMLASGPGKHSSVDNRMRSGPPNLQAV